MTEIFPEMYKVIPEGISNQYTIEHYEISKKQADMYRLRSMMGGDINGTMVEAGKYCRLMYVNGYRTIVMSDTGGERRSNLDVVENSTGDILIGGLGIGMVVCGIVTKPEVNSITIIEKSPDVITLVKEPLLKYLGDLSHKVTIIQSDIFEYKPTQKYNTIYFDIWNNISGDEYPETKTLHKQYRKYLIKGGWMDSWMRWKMKQSHFNP